MTHYVAEHLADLPPRMANGVKPTTCIVREIYEVRPAAVGVHTSGPCAPRAAATGIGDRSRAVAVGACLALVSTSARIEKGLSRGWHARPTWRCPTAAWDVGATGRVYHTCNDGGISS